MDNLQQQYLELGYIITEIEGLYYVQKQKTTGNGETITVPALWDERLINNSST